MDEAPGELVSSRGRISERLNVARGWQTLSGTAKLLIGLILFLVLQLVLFAFSLTRIIAGFMIPIDPFHPWALQLLLIILTCLFLLIALLAWLIALRNERAEDSTTSLRAD